MINTHCPLRILKVERIPIIYIHLLILQVRERNDRRCTRLFLETQLSIPGHVLDGQESAGSDNHEVEVGVGDQDAIRSFDYLGEDFLDGIKRAVFAVDEDRTGAFGPRDLGRRVHGCFDVGAVEV